MEVGDTRGCDENVLKVIHLASRATSPSSQRLRAVLLASVVTEGSSESSSASSHPRERVRRRGRDGAAAEH